MKFALLALAPVALAVPTTMEARETIQQTTDRYLFSISLPSFLQFRAQRNPGNLDWSSNGCSASPDNPFGFPFEPACQRHDFGYRNYKAQNRFDSGNRKRVDDNFKNEYAITHCNLQTKARLKMLTRNSLYFQCETVSAKGSCRALANVYYSAVRVFGGVAKRAENAVEESTEDLIASYYTALQEYNDAVDADIANGLLSAE
ncbi:hypothetical protein NQ176_g11117 [Zarea fungicola]|uniref:Uncharacterized protein n=1 Tax=Zarea fungicola TaxID=93591 RepID=A0ACC1ME62_9HYPO|nr:hypothetical protein NQ176_g11117 [Lecanicillium fungicola]